MTASLTTSVLLVSQVAVPALWFAVNCAVRSTMRLKQSSGADAILVLLVFDAAVLVDGVTFSRLVANPEFAEHIAPAHMAFLLLGLISWIFALRFSEPSIVAAHEWEIDSKRTKLGAWRWFCGWFLLFVLIILHVSYFVLPLENGAGG